MSGSPRIPPHPQETTSPEPTGRLQGGYQPTATHDVSYRAPDTYGDVRLQTTTAFSSFGRPYPAESSDRLPYPLAQTEQHIPALLPHVQQGVTTSQQHQYLPNPTNPPGPAPQTFPTAPRQTSEVRQSSPKLQRKTKGHVASACVPCKRAHLRCDSQRPCSRCLSNGKEDACVDVQHKKRGRPRLREDRDPKAESSRVGSSREASVRGPSFLYRPGSSSIIGYEESTTRNQSQPYRALQSQTNEGPEKREGVPEGHLNMLPAPLSISTGAPEPVAFLTTDLEIARASATFLDALAWPSLNGAKLADVVVPGDRDKVLGHQRQLQEEQRTREPTYLPPIFGKQEEDRVIQSLGFGPDELSRYGLERQDFLTFTGRDGHARSFPVRMGLAKQGSIYFVVLSLSLAARHSHYPTPSPNPRDIAYSYQPAAQAYSQRTPVSATFDPRQNRLGEVSYGVRRAGGLESTHQTVSPGAPAAYATSPSRPEYPVAQPQPPSYPLPPVPVPVGGRPPQSSSYQLPPIRSQQQQADPATQNVSLQSREERARVDIGGLIDPSNHPTEPKP